MSKLHLIRIVAVVISSSAYANPATDSFSQMNEETGCSSNHTDTKKEQIFNNNYVNRQMTVSGTVADVEGDRLLLKVLPDTLTFDVKVEMANVTGLADLDKGTPVTVHFTIKGQGGCILPYSGINGTLVQ